MLDFFSWFRSDADNSNREWLILGKGPSFERRHSFDLSSFNTVSLNHVVSALPVTIAHAIDLDVVDHCADALALNATYLLMPWIPHQDFKPGNESLDQLRQTHPTLRSFDEKGCLLWYNIWAPWYNPALKELMPPGIPSARAGSFSAVSVIDLLSQAGVRSIRTLGIDGGTNYSENFAHLSNITLLANHKESFDSQFQEISQTVAGRDLVYAPLGVDAPAKVYVGATPHQKLAVKVLEYSIMRHSGMRVDVVPLYQSNIEIPVPNLAKNRGRTPFSFQRFLIPALCNYRGRAIYLDSDMLVFRNIEELWTTSFDGADLLSAWEPGSSGRLPQFSVMLLNCESLRWDVREIVSALDAGQFSYEDLMRRMVVAKTVRSGIDPKWNSLERYDTQSTCLLHYTDMSRQPWLSTRNPLGHLWVSELISAIESGFITIEELENEVKQGFVRPSLLYQVAAKIRKPKLFRLAALALDIRFKPPHRRTEAETEKIPPIATYKPLLALCHQAGILKRRAVSFRKSLKRRLVRRSS